MSTRSLGELSHNVVLLARQGMSRRAIARALDIGRNTVRKLLIEHAQKRQRPHQAIETPRPRVGRPSKLDAHRDSVVELLSSFPHITAQRVLEQLRERGFTGGYTAVKRLVRKLRPKPSVRVSLPTPVYGPGEMAESDWSTYRVEFTEAPPRRLYAFAYVLVYSRRRHFDFYERCDLFALMDGHVGAFEAFSGAAHQTKYDGQKAVVLRWEGRQPIFNPRFVDFATYYEFRPVACRPGHPNDKPHCERSFWELERSFFNGRKFRDENDLKLQLELWRRGVCDRRRLPHSTETRLERFEEEKPHLRPLPTHPFDTARVIYRLCDIEGYIAWEGNRYSLPFEHVTDILPVRITQKELFVYAADLSLIARHELQPKGKGLKMTLPGHRPRQKVQGPELDQLRKAYEQMGPVALKFLAALETHKPRSAGYQARHILALRERYATADLLDALTHALGFGVFEHDAIERILLVRARPRRLDEYVAQAATEKLGRLLGQSQTEPRDLSEYDALPNWSQGEGNLKCPSAAKQPPLVETDSRSLEGEKPTEPSPPESQDSKPISNSSA